MLAAFFTDSSISSQTEVRIGLPSGPIGAWGDLENAAFAFPRKSSPSLLWITLST